MPANRTRFDKEYYRQYRLKNLEVIRARVRCSNEKKQLRKDFELAVIEICEQLPLKIGK